MLKNYLEILKESLLKKKAILTELYNLSKKQGEIAGTVPFDTDSFDTLVDQKDDLVNRILELDNGFEETYRIIKDELPEHKDEFKEEIRFLQELIKNVTELSMSLQALEERNKRTIETAFLTEHKRIDQTRRSSKAALDYYKSMSQVNYIDPQLMDQKK